MKKKILLLALLVSVPVFAKEYTDYEYVGEQTTKPIVDEFTKYETIVKHKYYSLREESDILDKYDASIDDYDTCTSSPIKKEVITSVKPEHYDSDRLIAIRASENFKVTRFRMRDFDAEKLKISKIVMSVSGETYKVLENIRGVNDIIVDLPGIWVNDLEVTLFYQEDKYNQPSISFDGINTPGAGMMLSLENMYDHTIIKPFTEDKKEELGFNDNKLQYHFRYYQEFCNCVKYERVYHEDVDELDVGNYLFDENEDMFIYKIYRREEKSSVDEPDKYPVIIEPPYEEAPSIDDNIKNDVIIEKPTAPAGIGRPSNSNSVGSIVENRNNNTIVDEETGKDKGDKEYDKIAIFDKEMFDDDKDDVKTESVPCTDYDEISRELKELKLLLLIIIILTILHTIQLLYVNSKN